MLFFRYNRLSECLFKYFVLVINCILISVPCIFYTLSKVTFAFIVILWLMLKLKLTSLNIINNVDSQKRMPRFIFRCFQPPVKKKREGISNDSTVANNANDILAALQNDSSHAVVVDEATVKRLVLQVRHRFLFYSNFLYCC